MAQGIEKKAPHHHGDLPRALIAAGIDLLESDGIDGLSLRKCAAKAGVSHGAPAHHFGGLDGLLKAIAGEGFTRFRLSMELARAAGPQTDLGRLKSICTGYFDFAVAHPALTILMFNHGEQSSTKQVENDSRSYGVLRDACAPFATTPQAARVLETQVWSLIHGYSTLYLAGALASPVQSVPDRGPLDAVLETIDALVGNRV